MKSSEEGLPVDLGRQSLNCPSKKYANIFKHAAVYSVMVGRTLQFPLLLMLLLSLLGYDYAVEKKS